MKRSTEIKKKIAALENELNDLPIMHSMGVREFGRVAGISPTTAGRFMHGNFGDLRTIKAALPYLGKCPCCGEKVKSLEDLIADKMVEVIENMAGPK